jgi:hypothetical protein
MLNFYSNHFNVRLNLNYFMKGNLQLILGNISGKFSAFFSS